MKGEKKSRNEGFSHARRPMCVALCSSPVTHENSASYWALEVEEEEEEETMKRKQKERPKRRRKRTRRRRRRSRMKRNRTGCGLSVWKGKREKKRRKVVRSWRRCFGTFSLFFWFISNYKPEFHFHSSLLVEDNFIHMLDVGGVSSFHFYRGWLSILSISIKVESKLIPYHIIKVSVQLLVQSNSVKSIRIRSNLVKISQLQSKTQLSPKPY